MRRKCTGLCINPEKAVFGQGTRCPSFIAQIIKSIYGTLMKWMRRVMEGNQDIDIGQVDSHNSSSCNSLTTSIVSGLP